MDILGIGPLELLFILIIALVFIGPDKLPQMGAKLGRSVKDMRRATREFSREVDAARQSVESPINDIKQPFQEIAEPFQEVSKVAASMTSAAKNMKDPAKALRESVMRELSLDGEPEEPAQPDGTRTPDCPADAGRGRAFGAESAAPSTCRSSGARTYRESTRRDSGIDQCRSPAFSALSCSSSWP